MKLDYSVIEAWARRNNLTSAQAVADELDIDRRTLLRHKAGHVEPTLGAAVRIAHRIGVKLDDLIEPPATVA